MIKKINRLLENKLFNVIVLGVMSMGVIWMTQIFAKYLSKAQELQRMETPSTLQNTLTFLLLIILTAMVYIICKCALSIGDRIIKQRNEHRMWCKRLIDEELDARVLRRRLFNEMKNNLAMPDEENLWGVLCQLNKKELIETIEERGRILYEMGIEVLEDN